MFSLAKIRTFCRFCKQNPLNNISFPHYSLLFLRTTDDTEDTKITLVLKTSDFTG